MASFDGNRVTREWHTVLTAAREDGVHFTLNDGQRTFREQQALYSRNMSGGRPRPGRPLTAYPSHTAPHIKTGRIDHAIDVNDEDLFNGTRGGADNLIRWARSKGATLRRTVSSEPWHLEIEGGESALRALAARVADRTPRFTRAEKRTVYLITKIRSRPSTRARRSAIRALKLAIRGYREAIKVAARRSGWTRNDRRDRYLALGRVYNAEPV